MAVAYLALAIIALHKSSLASLWSGSLARTATKTSLASMILPSSRWSRACATIVSIKYLLAFLWFGRIFKADSKSLTAFVKWEKYRNPSVFWIFAKKNLQAKKLKLKFQKVGTFPPGFKKRGARKQVLSALLGLVPKSTKQTSKKAWNNDGAILFNCI